MRSFEDQRSQAGLRVLIMGTGGQGALTIARLLSDCLVELGHDVVSGQLHSMAQRGGSVQSSVLINCGIGPEIAGGQADVVLGLEPIETARALPMMSLRTVVYMNTASVRPFVLGQRFVRNEAGAAYPDVMDLIAHVRAVTPHVFSFDATRLAQESGSIRTMNTVMLGCLLGSGLLPCTADDFWETAAARMPEALVEANAEAFRRGVEIGSGFQVGVREP